MRLSIPLSTFLFLLSTNVVHAHENSEKMTLAQIGHGHEMKLGKALVDGAKGSILSLENRFSRDSFEDAFSKHVSNEKVEFQPLNDHRFTQEGKFNFDSRESHKNWDLNANEAKDRNRWEHALDEYSWSQKFDPKHLGWEDDGRYHFCTDPVPEPQNYAMMSIGLIVILGFAKRSRS